MKKLAPLFIIIAAILWGLDGVVLTPKLYSLPVPFVVLIEHAVAFLLMLPFFIYEIKEFKKVDKGGWGAFVWIALFGGAIGTMAITKALFYVNFVNLSIVILLQKLQPIFALSLAWLVLKEKLPKKFWLWAAAAVVAAYLITFGFSLPNLATGGKLVAAALFAILAAFAFGSSTVFSKRGLNSVNFRMGTYLRFGLTSLVMLLIVLSMGQIGSFGQVTPMQWLIFLIIALTTGGGAIFLYYYGLKQVTASVSTICELALPASGIIFSYVFYGQTLSVVQWIGAIILIYSMYKVTAVTNT